jgi:hypothetical protein
MSRLARLATFVMSATTFACIGDDGRPSGPIIIVVSDGGGAPPTNDGSAPATAKKNLGDECATESECASGVCFKGTKSSYCSLTCTPSNASSVCVPPVFDGVCNNQGYCRKPG